MAYIGLIYHISDVNCTILQVMNTLRWPGCGYVAISHMCMYAIPLRTEFQLLVVSRTCGETAFRQSTCACEVALVNRAWEQKIGLARELRPRSEQRPSYISEYVHHNIWHALLACKPHARTSLCAPVLPFQPIYRSGHPENYLFCYKNIRFYRIKVSKKSIN